MDRQAVVFVIVLAAVASIVYGVFFIAKLSLPQALVLLAIALAFVAFMPYYEVFPEYERGVVFRLGKFYKIVGPGWIMLFSNIDRVVRADLRTQVVDTKPQEVITQDNIKIKIDAVSYIRVVDPKKTVIEIRDYHDAITHMLLAQIRSVVGRLTLEEVLERTEEINRDLHDTLKEVEDAWGISTLKVEIQSIELPPDLLDAMRKRKEADEYKAKVETEAQARRVSLEILDQAASKMSDTTMTYLYLDALKKLAEGKSNKIIFPLELSHLASKLSGTMKGGNKTDYGSVVEGLIDSYREKQKEELDAEEEVDKEKKPEKKKKK
ncbi:Stomatin [Candidatus Norongarragalina meridionalis]|nr:Stomatin [Candidatus Norongarragalina meridionalis]